MTRPASFDASVMACRGPLRGCAMKHTKNRDKAEDLVQDTIEKALRTWDQYRHDTNLLGWLFVMMRNIHFTNIRKNWRLAEDPDGIHASMLAVPAAQEAPLDLQDVASAMDRLTPEYRQALLGSLDEVPYAVMAQTLGTTEGTIKSRVNRARAHLREMVA